MIPIDLESGNKFDNCDSNVCPREYLEYWGVTYGS